MFKRLLTPPPSGTCLQMYVQIDQRLAAEKFGNTDSYAYFEPERGYDGDEWTFTTESGDVARLYYRWGQARIGAHSDVVAGQFAAWLSEQFERPLPTDPA